ncbi:hypothetical protein QP446_11335 [Corynebacterium riegelii]|uniref:hypothetical protein n=1 Tax=Corynebacterium riegelii TaxID=156976 RepID=UPI00254E9803|nr:hypothetical protein [Corynebacterium riegelii]MDK7181342.1 hypothetical protein [Corynebacterium riegelii]
MRLLSQPFDGQLGDILIEALSCGAYDRLSIVVAFARNSGVLRLKDALEKFREAGGEVDVFVGVDLDGTSYEALINLLPLATTLRVVHDENGQTFHTKLFYFEGPKQSLLIVGSHNLTGGGLWTNFESSVRIPLDQSNPQHLNLDKAVREYLDSLRTLSGRVMLISNESEIQNLQEHRYVDNEVKAQVRRQREVEKRSESNMLFQSGPKSSIPGLPGSTMPGLSQKEPKELAIPEVEIVLPHKRKQLSHFADFAVTEDPTLWLETRKMTGGSRNILDLSKTSLLLSGTVEGTPYEHPDPEFMRGAVEFFGIDPEDTAREKQIVINFDGVDYAENTIKFPTGKRANGTWRVQIKGISERGEKITTVLKEKAGGGFLLPNKIVTFTRVDTDYYYLSVFPESELQEFLHASSITAYNGRSNTAKLLGLI